MRVTVRPNGNPPVTGSGAGAGSRSPAASWRSEPLLRWGARAWALVGILVAGYLLLRIVLLANVLVAPLLVAAVLVYLLNPVVGVLHRRGLPRRAGTAVAGLGTLALLAVAGVLVIPLLLDQVRNALAALPTDLEALEVQVDRAATALGLDVDVAVDGAAAQRWLAESGNRRLLFGSFSTAGSVVVSAAGVVLSVLVGAVLGLFVLSDLPGLRRFAVDLVPPARRQEARELAGEVGQAVGGFLRGQLLVATYVGVVSSMALWLVGLPLWLMVGVVAGVTNLVPFVGPFVGGALAVAIAVADGDLSLAVSAAAALLVVQLTESYGVSPLVMGRAVRLHPAVVMLVVLLGGSLGGLAGLLLAVPVTATIRVVARHVWRRTVHYADGPGTSDSREAPRVGPKATATSGRHDAVLVPPSKTTEGCLAPQLQVDAPDEPGG